MKSAFLLLLAALLVPRPLAAASEVGPRSWCGTEPSQRAISAARHRQFQRRLARAAGRRRHADFNVYQYRQIAVMEDNGTLVRDAHPVDLAGTAIQFLRRPRQRLSAVRFEPGLKTPYGTRLELGDDDSFEVAFPAGFRFPFGDQLFTSVFVNSDGNLTFGEPDEESYARRDLIRFLDGPPRIAVVYADLDPSAATGEHGVYLRFLPNRVRVTWFGVPEWGTENRNTVQVTLFPNGRSTVVFGDQVEAAGAIVGISPGGGADLELIDYTAELPFAPQPVAVAEQFNATAEVDHVGIAGAFFQYFEDAYDFLAVWLDFPHDLARTTNFAFELTVKNDVRGIGEGIFDYSAEWRTPERFSSLMQMGTLARYPDNPNLPLEPTAFSSLAIIAHEAGHRWLAKARYRTPTGELSTDLLGRNLTHWSFHHDTDGSLMEGNDLRDNGDGTFTTTAAATGFSALDQYLMGLIPAAEVDDFFYVAGVASPPRDATPQVGVTFSGRRIDVGVADVVAAEGLRDPAFGDAPNRFRMAFLLLAREGEPPTQASLSKLERFRRRLIPYFAAATDHQATVGTALFPKKRR